MNTRLAVIVAIVTMAACSREPLAPQGHLVVWLDTDAPSPKLLDVMRVEVIAPDGHVVDVRELPLDTTSLRNGGLSFTIVPAQTGVPAGTLHAIAWQARDGRGTPRSAESVEGWFVLPPAPEDGAREITVFLGLDTVGAATGSSSNPAPAIDGHPGSKAGSWSGALSVPCAGDAGAEEACIRGGAFWMGHPRAADLGLASGGDRRLVVLSPFFLDRHNVTVAAYRRDGKVYAGRWSGTSNGTLDKDYCTFTDAVGPNEDMPLNCVQWQYAREFCNSVRKGDLPTETQLEYVASAFGASLYPWGDDPPGCDDAVWGRGGGAQTVAEINDEPDSCRPKTGTPRELIGSVEPVTRANVGRDQLVLSDGTSLQDLAGNLTEWARDSFVELSSDCWRPRQPNVFIDPVCITKPAASAGYSARGTAFYLPRSFAASAVRGGAIEGAHLDVGFRCMRPAQ